MLKSKAIGAAAFAVLSSLPMSALACDDLSDGARGVVAQVTDGDTIVLGSGIVVRMIGTQAPKLPLGREGYPTWPKAEEAKAALEAMALGKQVQLRYGGEEIDRYDRALAHVFVIEDGEPELWAQQAMVASGLARVYSFPDNRKCLPQLFAAEAKAWAAGIGIWSDPFYIIRQAERPDEIMPLQGQYELVEGRVLNAEMAGGRMFLNFGRSWKQDFTAVIEAPALRLFKADGKDPLVLNGALVRVRGWVDERDGPRIEITHPEQIEVLATR